jgi:protein-S-isoprenylcysteine O-methyltransferase Ste14
VLRKILSLCGFFVAAAAALGLFAIHHLLAHNPILLIVQTCAVLLMLWARATFGLRSFHPTANTTKGGLVTSGPYRYWRHPIYASIIYFVWAGQVEMPTTLSIALALSVTIGLVLRMVIEEQFLVTAYPEYSEYMRHAKRLIPFAF